MCDKELLVGYLYDELQGPARQTFQDHLESCAECREEVHALKGTRVQLASWAAAEPDLGLQIVRGTSRSASTRFRLMPAWGLAAAAVLVLAVASAIANVEVRFVNDGVTLRTGWSRNAAESSVPATQSLVSSDLDVAAFQQRLQRLETTLAAERGVQPLPAPAAASGRGGMSDAELFRRVNQLIADSELRQRQELAVRLVAGMREMQASHQDDMVRLQQTINQNQGMMNDEVFRQREEMKQFYRLVGTQSQR
jgi:hypothetical protein